MVKIIQNLFKLLYFRQLKSLFLFIFASMLFSSCKIFGPKKVAAGTHTHTKNEKPNTNAEYVISKSAELIDLARTYLGVPYKLGGTTSQGMDCSGLLFTVCNNAGIAIPRTSYKQAEIGEEVGLNEIQKGDFLFFITSKNSSQISHVGMVTEVSQPSIITFIHASTSKGVREDNLFSDYWKKAFTKATRPFVF